MTKMSALKTIRPHELSGNVSPEALARGELIEFFKGKGIGVFDDESVDNYKKEKRLRSNRIADFWDPVSSFTGTYLFLFGMCALGALACGLIAFQFVGVHWTVGLSAIGGLLIGLLLGFVVSVVCNLVWEHHFAAHWETVSYQKHNDDGRKIKRRVRELALMVEQERPDLVVCRTLRG